MNIFNETELYKYFKEVIDRAAGKELVFLENEIETLRTETFQQLSLSFEQKKQQALTQLEYKAKRDHQKFLSRLDQQVIRNIAQYRETLVASLLDALLQRFYAYQTTKEYIDSLNQALQGLPLADIDFIEVSTKDKAIIITIDQTLLRHNPEITGGYRVHYKDKKRLLDQTIESRLSVVKNWFYQHASLVINQTEDEVVANES